MNTAHQAKHVYNELLSLFPTAKLVRWFPLDTDADLALSDESIGEFQIIIPVDPATCDVSSDALLEDILSCVPNDLFGVTINTSTLETSGLCPTEAVFRVHGVQVVFVDKEEGSITMPAMAAIVYL